MEAKTLDIRSFVQSNLQGMNSIIPPLQDSKVIWNLILSPETHVSRDHTSLRPLVMYSLVLNSNLKNLKLEDSICSKNWVRHWRWPVFPEFVGLKGIWLLPVEWKWAPGAGKENWNCLKSCPRCPCGRGGDPDGEQLGPYCWVLQGWAEHEIETDKVINSQGSARRTFQVL